MSFSDAIDRLVGIEPGSRLDHLRAHRGHARDNAEASYVALFQPAEWGAASQQERHALAVFVSLLHREPDIAAFYAEGLADDALQTRLGQEAQRGLASGPYGSYPAGPLSVENVDGPVFIASPDLPRRLAAALTHAHLLVFHPRDASAEALQALEAAGWSVDGIVTLSQLAAFLSFQIRVVAGLRLLAKLPVAAPETV